MVDDVSLWLALSIEATRVTLLVTGVGAIPDMMLADLGLPNIWLNHKFSKMSRKHSLIMQCALYKHASIHQVVLEALHIGSISSEEYNKIATKVEQYNIMKRELQHKKRSEDAD